MPNKRAITSTRVVTPSGMKDIAILIDGERITQLTSRHEIPDDYKTYDYANLIVMPGIIDSHVHVNEPGRTEWEGFETATKAAAAGGITTIIDMPLNSSPVTTTKNAFEQKLSSTIDKLWVDCGFYGGITSTDVSDISDLANMGVMGYKSFLINSGIDEYPHVNESTLREIMPLLSKIGLPLLVHAELESPVDISGMNPIKYSTYLHSRPRKWENDAIKLIINLVRQFKTHVHIIHLSSSDALQIIREAKTEGLPITVETCPHYLHFSSENIDDGQTQFKCAPPIREEENRELLWQGITEGLIDTIGSDHSPCTPSLKNMKTGNFMTAWGGISSVQFTLSTIWTEFKKREYSIEKLVSLLCEAPSRLVGLENVKGKLEPGYYADIVIWDPDDEISISQDIIQHKHKLTPYLYETLKGKVHSTILRGQIIYDQGVHIDSPTGMIIRGAK